MRRNAAPLPLRECPVDTPMWPVALSSPQSLFCQFQEMGRGHALKGKLIEE